MVGIINRSNITKYAIDQFLAQNSLNIYLMIIEPSLRSMIEAISWA